MSQKVAIPQVDANMQEGTLGQWHVAVGERVEQDQPLVELQTDKASFEVEAPAAGEVLAIIAPERSVLPPGYTIAIIGEAGETLPEYEAGNAALLRQNDPFADLDIESVDAAPQSRRPKKARVRATPAARRLAAQEGVDLDAVKEASGAQIIDEDLLKEFLNGR